VNSSAPDPYVRWALRLAQASAAVANYCDHAEHNEPAERSWVTAAAATLRELALACAEHEGLDLAALYVARLRQIEERNPLWSPDGLDGAALASQASTWRQLQLAQVEHDRRFHPDIIGLSKADQLRHNALHLAKLTGAMATLASGEGNRSDFCTRRLPDLLLFGLKLSTVTGESLPEQALPAGKPLALVGTG
jgi:hypothetical protein